jgi:BirA family biotin operon repressor/biotin-[acetyl-CoA-carboxylase] ligase
MDIDSLNASLAGTPFAGNLHHFATLASTNSHALHQAVAGAPKYSVYVADQQTAGRGRGAHTWHSSPGDGLYVSVLLRPNLTAQESLWLSLAAGLAAHHAVANGTRAKPDLRWPNDLMVQENGVSKKFGGILAETQTEGDRLRHAVVGIGININHTEFPPDIAPLATSLYLASGQKQSREELLLALLRALHREIESLETTLPRGADILHRLSSASTWIRGKRVRVTDHDDVSRGFTGTTAGLDARGFLLVDTATGQRTVISGSVREATD